MPDRCRISIFHNWNLEFNKNGNCLYKVGEREKWYYMKSVQARWETDGEELQGATSAADVDVSQNSFDRSCSAELTDFTHRHRHTVSALHWRWGEGRKNSERSQACSHTSHSYSTRGPGTHSHLQRAPQTLVTVWTSAWGQLLVSRWWTQ